MSSAISNFSAFSSDLRNQFKSDVGAVRNDVKQRNQDVQQARQDIQAGDQAGAQQAFDAAKQLTTTIQTDRTAVGSLRTEVKGYQTDVASYKQAVQAGDATAAKAALDQVTSDRKQLRSDFAAFYQSNNPGGPAGPPTIKPGDDAGGAAPVPPVSVNA